LERYDAMVAAMRATVPAAPRQEARDARAA